MNKKNIRENTKDNEHHLDNLTDSNPKTIKVILNNDKSFAGV